MPWIKHSKLTVLNAKADMFEAQANLYREERNRYYKRGLVSEERAERVMKAYDLLLCTDRADPTRLAQEVATWDDSEQAAFFNALAEAPAKLGWRPNMDGPIVADGEGQWWHVARKLNEVAEKMFEDFAYFITYRKENE